MDENLGGSRGKGGNREREGRRTVQVQRTVGGGGRKLDGWEEGEEDSGEFGNGSGWPEREEVRGGSDGEKTGEIVEFLQGRCCRSNANGGWSWRGWRHGGPEAAAAAA